MLRAVLDTSVVISARLSPEGQQALILGLAIAQYFRCSFRMLFVRNMKVFCGESDLD